MSLFTIIGLTPQPLKVFTYFGWHFDRRVGDDYVLQILNKHRMGVSWVKKQTWKGESGQEFYWIVFARNIYNAICYNISVCR